MGILGTGHLAEQLCPAARRLASSRIHRLRGTHWSRLYRIFYTATCDDTAVAGFDDENFYRELGKSVGQCSIPMVQAHRDEACVALLAWLKENAFAIQRRQPIQFDLSSTTVLV